MGSKFGVHNVCPLHTAGVVYAPRLVCKEQCIITGSKHKAAPLVS